MKNFKILFTFPYLYITIFVLLMSNFMYAQVLSINPSVQSIAVESGQQISTNVTLLNQSNQYPINYKVRLWNGSSQGLIGVNPTLDQNLSLAQNGFQHYTFSFFLDNITNNQTTTFTFRVDWMLQNGLNIEATSYITINVTYLSGSCSLSPPGLRTTGNILSRSAVAGWVSAPNVSGYKIYLTQQGVPVSHYSPLITNNYYEFNNLLPNKSYYWQIKSICADGTEGNYNSPSLLFTTQTDCSPYAYINLPISTNKDISSSGTITASSTINSNLDVKFRASEVVLRPGFNVKGQSTGVFRAYVDPCAPGSSIGSKNQLDAELSMNESKILPSLSPNPTKTVLNVDNIADINEWKLVDINGKIVESGRVNNSIQTKITINTSRLISGVYYFNAVMKNGELFQKTVIKK